MAQTASEAGCRRTDRLGDGQKQKPSGRTTNNISIKRRWARAEGRGRGPPPPGFAPRVASGGGGSRGEPGPGSLSPFCRCVHLAPGELSLRSCKQDPARTDRERVGRVPHSAKGRGRGGGHPGPGQTGSRRPPRRAGLSHGLWGCPFCGEQSCCLLDETDVSAQSWTEPGKADRGGPRGRGCPVVTGRRVTPCCLRGQAMSRRQFALVQVFGIP